MKQRVITGVIVSAIVVLLLLSPVEVIHIAVAAVSIYALFEMYNALSFQKNIWLLLVNILFSGVILTGMWIPQSLFMPLVFAYLICIFLSMLFSQNNIPFAEVTLSSFMLVYIVFTLLHIVLVRRLEFGAQLIFLIFIGACCTDAFAYFVGVLIGKHKLCPKISPKKTIEGAVGGVLGVVLCFYVFGLIVEYGMHLEVYYAPLLLLGGICGVLSEIGDLAASMIKRQYNIKDYGHILPGHGGIMDRLDSIILIAPLVYYFVKYIPVLG